jgi:hypothetical protein
MCETGPPMAVSGATAAIVTSRASETVLMIDALPGGTAARRTLTLALVGPHLLAFCLPAE